MKFVSVRELRGQPADVWKELARRKELVVTSNGRPIAILTASSEESLEEDLASIRRARAVRAAASLQRAALEGGLDRLPEAAIEAEIRAARKSRGR
jgi:prevent-host-death family protein